MASTFHPRTLLHLVPQNELSSDALQHPDNRHFVSSTATNKLGLEIGFHVPSFSRGHVITRLGRNTDLVLRQSFSGVHIAFEVHPETLVIMLTLRSKHEGSVSIAPLESGGARKGKKQGEPIYGDCVLLYGQDYVMKIASYHFEVVWLDLPVEGLREKVLAEYQDSMRRLKDVRSRDLSVAGDSVAVSYYMTRLRSSKEPLVKEAAVPRVFIGGGSFGKVYKALDQKSGNYFAVKVVDLNRQVNEGNVDKEYARSSLHREVKLLENLSHENIVKCLGSQKFQTDKPEIFMPLCKGTVCSLIDSDQAPNITTICNQVLKDALCGLDYTAARGVCHRDVKPDNILYIVLGENKYRFMLSDFGLSKHYKLARTHCGTPLYQAPEVWKGGEQTPKMDVWSLFATIAYLHPEFNYPPPNMRIQDIVPVVQALAQVAPELSPMARIDPLHRASAAQMLVRLFEGKGLTTAKDRVPPISPEFTPESGAKEPLSAPTEPPQAAGPSSVPARNPLVFYPPPRLLGKRPAPRPSPAPGALPNQFRTPAQDARHPVHVPARDRGGVTKKAATPSANRPGARLNRHASPGPGGQPPERQ